MHTVCIICSILYAYYAVHLRGVAVLLTGFLPSNSATKLGVDQGLARAGNETWTKFFDPELGFPGRVAKPGQTIIAGVACNLVYYSFSELLQHLLVWFLQIS